MSSPEVLQNPQCQHFVQRKKRLCRMTVKPGKNYCGEHDPQPLNEEQPDTRIPCPLDPKHTCYASKLEKHLKICNARQGDLPPYIVENINNLEDYEQIPKLPLSKIPTKDVVQIIDKVNALYQKIIINIESYPEKPIHSSILPEFKEADRQETSRRHLRQASQLMHLVEELGLVKDSTCYVELGAGKGHLSYYACTAWCGGRGRSTGLLVDRAALRHKRDNKLRDAHCLHRIRADLAHTDLEQVDVVKQCDHVVGFAKHLCGVATDFALRCCTIPKTRGIVLATCCHHRAHPTPYLQDLGINAAEFNIILGIVSWATCGDGRSRDKRANDSTDSQTDELTDSQDGRQTDRQNGDDEVNEIADMPREFKEETGRRAKRLIDWSRVQYLKSQGFDAKLVYYVPTSVSLENVCIVARRLS